MSENPFVNSGYPINDKPPIVCPRCRVLIHLEGMKECRLCKKEMCLGCNNYRGLGVCKECFKTSEDAQKLIDEEELKYITEFTLLDGIRWITNDTVLLENLDVRNRVLQYLVLTEDENFDDMFHQRPLYASIIIRFMLWVWKTDNSKYIIHDITILNPTGIDKEHGALWIGEDIIAINKNGRLLPNNTTGVSGGMFKNKVIYEARYPNRLAKLFSTRLKSFNHLKLFGLECVLSSEDDNLHNKCKELMHQKHMPPLVGGIPKQIDPKTVKYERDYIGKDGIPYQIYTAKDLKKRPSSFTYPPMNLNNVLDIGASMNLNNVLDIEEVTKIMKELRELRFN